MVPGEGGSAKTPHLAKKKNPFEKQKSVGGHLHNTKKKRQNGAGVPKEHQGGGGGEGLSVNMEKTPAQKGGGVCAPQGRRGVEALQNPKYKKNCASSYSYNSLWGGGKRRTRKKNTQYRGLANHKEEEKTENVQQGLGCGSGG